MLDKINKLVQTNSTRLDWDQYYMSIALLASCRSPCTRLHVGSVIVKDNRIVSMGYNGFLAGCLHNSHVVDGHEQAIAHSEINAIADCAKRGVSIDESKIYITHYPCINCFKALASSGIKEIIYLNDYKNNDLVQIIASESKILIRKMES